MTKFKTLTDREHILLRPAMYIGATDLTTSQEYILENDKIELTEVSVVPGLIKIINELIDNSVDVAIKSNFKSSNKIDVTITRDSVTVKDNGTGIPIIKTEEGYIPRLAWGQSRAGTNFSDDENRTQIGMNGVGSYATNCFSSKFIGKTDDGNKSYTVTFTNNASEYKEVLGKSKKAGTEVQFFPDFPRFGISEIDETHIKIIQQRLINLSMSFPEIRFRLNNERINSGTFKKFAEMFGDEPVILETENYRYAFLYNAEDDFRHFSYVNGLKIPEGGTHIDAVVEPIVQRIREKLQRRYKGIKPADIRNKLLVLCYIKDFPNAKFNSQSKEKITNTNGEIISYLGLDNKDLDKLSNQIYRNKPIIEGITEIFKIKEEFRKRQELKALKRPKKIKSEKYIPAIKNKKYLLITEGDSAAGGLIPALGRENIGYYVLKGKPLNVITNSHQKFISNKELSELFQIIQNEDYEYIISATDSDTDGDHIFGLLAGFIHKMLPDLKDRFGRLHTPVKVALKNDIPVRWVYNLADDLEIKRGEQFNYMKGLGSWDPEDLKEVIDKEGMQNIIRLYEFDDDEILMQWLDKDSEPRKKYILENDFSIDKI